MIVLSSSLPTLGDGALKDREDPKALGTAKACFAYQKRCERCLE